MRWILPSLAILAMAPACGGSTEQDSKGSGGITGGNANGGSGALGGSGGSPSGGGGSGGIGPECQSAADCKLFTDCCSCEAVSPSDPAPASCALECKQSLCSELGVSDANVACVAGRCVAGFDCNPADAFCNALPPSCAAGQVPSVHGGCWGPCVDATQCLGVSICTDCTGALTTCVEIELQVGAGGAAALNSHCVDVPKGCEGTPVCACMAPSVCTPPTSACMDLSGLPGMLCSCPNC